MRGLDLSTIPILHTERLRLRPLAVPDAEALFRIRSDERSMQYIGRPRATSLADAAALIATNQALHAEQNGMAWAITLKEHDELIGTIGYYRLKKEHFRGEVGYQLHPDHWRKGFMREALEAVVQYGFRTIGFHSIEAVTDPNNSASNALLLSCGFVREGHFRQNYYWNGTFFDSAVFSRLAPVIR